MHLFFSGRFQYFPIHLPSHPPLSPTPSPTNNVVIDIRLGNTPRLHNFLDPHGSFDSGVVDVAPAGTGLDINGK